MRKLLDPDNEELRRILQSLLDSKVEISYQEIVNRHSGYSNKSLISRHEARRNLVKEFQEKQRAVAAAGPSEGKLARKAIETLEKGKEKLRASQKQNEALRSSLVACIDAVIQHGASESLVQFYATYVGIAEQVRLAGVELPSAEVVSFAATSDRRKKSGRA